MSSPSTLDTAAGLKQHHVTIRRFDPEKGPGSGEEFVLPVGCIDEEHAISSTLANTVALTKKSQGGEVLPVAFCCVDVQERK